MPWNCDKGGPVRDTIRVDGSDACDCDTCRRRALVQAAIGTADAGASGLADAIRYLSVDDWNDVPQAYRIVDLYRQAFARLADDLRQAVGDRDLVRKH